MNLDTLTLSRRSTLLWMGAAAACVPLAARAVAPLPGTSIYQLTPALTDQDGKPFELASLRGQPVLVSMFYSSCEMVCPMIFETIHQTVKALPAAERERARVLMVSFDPTRDTTEVLKQTAQAHSCDAHWTLARGDDVTARKIAAVLGVQYRRLASGEFNHSSTIELLDAEGRIAARSGKLGGVDADLVKAYQKALSAARSG